MAVRPVYTAQNVSAATAASQERLEINPARTIQCTEFTISLNAAPDSTAAPIQWDVVRLTVAGTGGTAATIVDMQDDLGQATGSAANQDRTLGTAADTFHSVFVPNVSGFAWVAAPGREFDCIAAEFLSWRNAATLPTGVAAITYAMWEE